MPIVGKIKLLPKPVLEELHERLRHVAYGGFVEHSAWLEQQGYIVSKSAIHRYAQELKARDSVMEKAVSLINVPGGDVADRGEAVELLVELGMMRMREAEIIARLTQLGVR